MATKTITIDQLHADYAQPIADEAGLDTSDYDRDAAGLASLLRDASDGIDPQVAEWLEDAADGLNAVALLGDDGPKTQELLKEIDRALYQVRNDL
jgi:hypothetical protein